MMIFLSIALIFLVNFFLSRPIKFNRPLDFILANFLIVCANLILSFEVVSLLGILNSQWAFLAIQMVWAAGAAIFYFRFKKTHSLSRMNLRLSFTDLVDFCRRNKGFTTFFVIILLGYLFLAVLSIVYPQNTIDSLYNHLSRIGHWLQQGSLKPFDSFNNYGITYPYNNSLLMMWSVLFLNSDVLTGLVQWFASFILAMSIYGLAIQLNFSKKQAGFSALIFLTFPIILLQSMTAQNDILSAAFFMSGVYLFISGLKQSDWKNLLFSALSIALAIGTKQYLLFAAPGFLLIFIYYMVKKDIPQRLRLGRNFAFLLLLFTLLLGSYTYIQNFVYYRNFSGPPETAIINTQNNPGQVGQKLVFNSTRLATQFISCEGMPLPLENQCLAIKGQLLREIFSNPNFNLENHQFLLEPDCQSVCFSYSTRYPLNEESAWFGILSWILLLPGLIIAVVISIRKKELLPILLILTSFIYFLLISILKTGWDAYLGRYLILSLALVMPFTGYLLSDQVRWRRVLTAVFAVLSIFIFVFSILDNDSKPLITKQKMVQVQLWGKQEHVLLVTKLAYKITPWFTDEHSYLDFKPVDLRTFAANDMVTPVTLVDLDVPLDESLGIIADRGQFPDYFFFGKNFTRKVYDLPDYADSAALAANLQKDQIHYLLVSPDITLTLPQQFHLIDQSANWLIYAAS